MYEEFMQNSLDNTSMPKESRTDNKKVVLAQIEGDPDQSITTMRTCLLSKKTPKTKKVKAVATS